MTSISRILPLTTLTSMTIGSCPWGATTTHGHNPFVSSDISNDGVTHSGRGTEPFPHKSQCTHLNVNTELFVTFALEGPVRGLAMMFITRQSVIYLAIFPIFDGKNPIVLH